MSRHLPLPALLGLALLACERPHPTGPLAGAEAIWTAPMNAIIPVTNTADAGPGSLRDAIAGAPTGSTITFDPAIAGQTITLTSGELAVVGKSLTIEGPATTGITISGGGTSRILSVAIDAALTLRNATVTGGMTGQPGAGIYSEGTLAIDHSTISNNNALASAYGIVAGGGIWASGPTTISNSTISGNSAGTGPLSFGLGGGLALNGLAASTRELVNVTIANNVASSGGSGLHTTQPVTLRNTIIAANQGPNCAAATLVLAGVSLSTDATCGAASAGLLVVTDAKLGFLAANGGPTKTHALLLGSLAIEAATACSVDDDQRHIARPQGAACDIGAYEFTEFVRFAIAIDPSATINSKTGVVLLSGTVDCGNAVGDLPLAVTISQPQKVGKVNVVMQASVQTTVTCGGSTVLWSVFVAPTSGAFQNGTATVNAISTAPTGYLAAPATAVVKLFWSKG